MIRDALATVSNGTYTDRATTAAKKTLLVEALVDAIKENLKFELTVNWIEFVDCEVNWIGLI